MRGLLRKFLELFPKKNKRNEITLPFETFMTNVKNGKAVEYSGKSVKRTTVII